MTSPKHEVIENLLTRFAGAVRKAGKGKLSQPEFDGEWQRARNEILALILQEEPEYDMPDSMRRPLIDDPDMGSIDAEAFDRT